MRPVIYTAILIAQLIIHSTSAQQFDQLHKLNNYKTLVYYSAGHEQRAASIAQRLDKAMAYYQPLLQFTPTVTLLVLSIPDWTKYTTLPVVYGMPHYNEKTKTLVVAAEDNEFWKSFLPPLEQLPQDFRQQIQTVYRNGDHLSMQPFFDLLALHELGHAFHDQRQLNMQRNWMGELFVNMLLHAYIAEHEPASLPALTLFPKMVIAGGTKEFRYTSLQDIEERYNEIGQHFPKNYGWYQCRWHFAAGEIYDAGGENVSRHLWEALKTKTEIPSDEELIAFLATVDERLAAVIRNWDADTIK